MTGPEEELKTLRAQVVSLTERINLLERKVGIEQPSPREQVPLPAASQVPPPRIEPPEERPVSVKPVSHAAPSAPPFISSQRERKGRDLEGEIGKLWFNRIGIVAILVGVSYFLKYAFDQRWIGPTARVTLGFVAGIAVILWSELFRKKAQIYFSYSLKAVGIGIIYLSLWGAYQIYHLVPVEVAFVAMILLTGFAFALALAQEAAVLATFALIGGFSTPLLLSTGENHPVVLFSYVAILDMAVLAILIARPWRHLVWAGFGGTAILYAGWYAEFYTIEQRNMTLAFTVLFAAIFVTMPLTMSWAQSRWHVGVSITVTLFPLIHAAAFFLALYALYSNERDVLTWFALALAAAYLGLYSLVGKLKSDPGRSLLLSRLLYVGIAVGFITIAIPLKLESHWITLAWLIESGALLGIAALTRTDYLRYFAACMLALGILRLLAFDRFQTEMIVFNARFACYLVAIAVLGGIVFAGSRYGSEREKTFVQLAEVLLNLLALIACTLEATDLFRRETALLQGYRSTAGPYQHLRILRDFSYSAIWLVYGAGLMMFGFWKRSKSARWQALALVAFTIGKVFLYDVSALEQAYRILSFIALGIVLLGISYGYHRDLLRLSNRADPTQRTLE